MAGTIRLCSGSNALQSAQGYSSNSDGQDGRCASNRNPRVELGNVNDGIHLGKGPDTKVSNKGFQRKRRLWQGVCTFPQTQLNVVHRAARNLTFGVDRAVFDSKDTFRVFCCHTKEGGNPHPEDGSRTACFNSCRDTDDIPRTNGGCKGCTQGLETVNVTFAGVFRLEDELQGLGQAGNLQEAQPQGEENPVPTSRTRSGGPQTKLSMLFKSSMFMTSPPIK